MDNLIIGITGKAQSGKDTVANMLAYILKNRTNASYSSYIKYEDMYRENNKNNILHFADTLKDCVSLIFNIDREYLDNSEYKDKKYFYVPGNKFFDEKDIDDRIFTKLSFEDFVKQPYLAYDSNILIKVRYLLQYIGTNLFRDNFSKDVWANSLRIKIMNLFDTQKFCIVPDVRFLNEYFELKKHKNFIMINVKRDNSLKLSHSSEKDLDVKYDFVIENNSNLLNLFYKLINFVESSKF